MSNSFFLMFLATGMMLCAGAPSLADGGSAVAAAAGQVEADAAKLLQKQWKVGESFFLFLNNGDSQRVKEALQGAGMAFPKGASAAYSAKKGILTLVNTQENIEQADGLVQRYVRLMEHPKMPLGRTTEDFKKWAKEEFKRRAAVYSSMKKVKDDKSARKCVDVMKRLYRYDLAEEKDVGNFVTGCACYAGSTDDVDPAVLKEVKKKFSKQVETIMQEQSRLLALLDFGESVWSGEECQHIIDYASTIHTISSKVDLLP